MGLELWCSALHPVFYPSVLQPFPIILISTEIPGGNGATEVNLLPVYAVCSISEFVS